MRWSVHLVRRSFHSKMCLFHSHPPEELEQLGLEELGLEELGLEELGLEELGLEELGLEELGLIRHFFHRRLGLCHRYKGPLGRSAPQSRLGRQAQVRVQEVVTRRL